MDRPTRVRLHPGALSAGGVTPAAAWDVPLPALSAEEIASRVAEVGLRSFMQQLEGSIIDWALQHAKTRDQAATLLGVNRTTLVEKLRRRGPGAARTGRERALERGAATTGRDCLASTASIALGAAMLDDEHRRILGLLDETHTAALRRDRRARQLHREVLDVIELHCEHEEASLAAAGFPRLAALRVEHAWLGSKIRALRLDVESRHDFVALSHCVVQHMLGADCEAAAWLAATEQKSGVRLP